MRACVHVCARAIYNILYVYSFFCLFSFYIVDIMPMFRFGARVKGSRIFLQNTK